MLIEFMRCRDVGNAWLNIGYNARRNAIDGETRVRLSRTVAHDCALLPGVAETRTRPSRTAAHAANTMDMPQTECHSYAVGLSHIAAHGVQNDQVQCALVCGQRGDQGAQVTHHCTWRYARAGSMRVGML